LNLLVRSTTPHHGVTGEGQPSAWEELKQQVLLGSDDFVAAKRRQVPTNSDLLEVPQARTRQPGTPLADYAQLHPDRNRSSAAACASGGLPAAGNRRPLRPTLLPRQ
jgi:hypothetical protein